MAFRKNKNGKITLHQDPHPVLSPSVVRAVKEEIKSNNLDCEIKN